jgi:Cytochrome C oxidase, cbb3-type, subunit III
MRGMVTRMLAAMFVLCATRAAHGQTVATDSMSTKNGVYTWQQAMRGRDIYAGNCRSCHTVESHTGAAFSATWNHRSLADLFGYMIERMPKNDPGSLAPQEYADVLAYVLKMNGLPAGVVELSPDSVALRAIRIDLPQQQSRTQP